MDVTEGYSKIIKDDIDGFQNSNFSQQGINQQPLEKIVDNIENGISDQILLGVTGSGKTYCCKCNRKIK